MNDLSTPHLDLDVYLARTGWSGERRTTADVLRGLHRAHLTSIPFENAQPVLGSVPSLNPADLEAKLLRGSRGGYCYEQNSLLAAALQGFGFRVTYLTARVRLGGRGPVRPRTHMLLLVHVPGEEHSFLADVGFGAVGGLYEAIRLVADEEVADGPRRHRLVREPHYGPQDLWVLQAHQNGGWVDQYAFTLEPFEPVDFEVINWHIATNPRSPFHHTFFAQHTVPGGHLALTGRTLVTTRHDGSRTQRELRDNDEVLQVLAADFGIRLPAGTRLPA